jgi:hypothetical protein
MDALILARAQFGANITFHILFPTITIAMAWLLLFFKLRYNKTQDLKWMEAYRFYVKVFALCFALGVVSGITMSFQFGTNWAYYSHYVGDIFGSLLAIEGLMAFFLEATLIGLFFFGWKKLSKPATKPLANVVLTKAWSNIDKKTENNYFCTFSKILYFCPPLKVIMPGRRDYDIAFVGLKPGTTEFDYELGNEFFEPEQPADFTDIQAHVKLKLDKHAGFMQL